MLILNVDKILGTLLLSVILCAFQETFFPVDILKKKLLLFTLYIALLGLIHSCEGQNIIFVTPWHLDIWIPHS